MKPGLWLALLWPALAGAWEEEPALAFILAWHPVITAQRGATAAYQPPTWTRRVLEHTSVFVWAASGASSTVAESGDTMTSSPLTVGIQVNIPLSSPREQREFAQQALAEATSNSHFDPFPSTHCGCKIENPNSLWVTVPK